MNKVLSLVFVVLAVFVGICHAAKYMYVGNYVLRNRETYSDGHVNGVVYYYYNEEDLLSSRIYFETSYRYNNKDVISKQLYHYKNNALYSFCTQCMASKLNVNPEKWWNENPENDTSSCEALEDGYYRCTRNAVAGGSVYEVVSKGTVGTSDFDVKFVKFNDGREYTLSGFSGVPLQYNTYKERLEITSSMKCPEPVCKSFVDIVFVLDSSESVDDDEWTKTKAFVTSTVQNFQLGPKDAYVGVVEFSAPDETCRSGWSGWYDRCCDQRVLNHTTVTLKPNAPRNSNKVRFYDDCMFDQKCNNKTDYTAKILLELGHENVLDRISKITHMPGHTCQRYGLIKAYEMLFERNTRCTNGVCPTPIVIVVTDGEDLCHASTKEWAEKLKAADDRLQLLEVGVGLKAQFDEDYLKELSSTFATGDTALSVDNYDQINSILDNVIVTTCDLGATTEGSCPSCRGFCVCSECFCPICDSDNDDACSYHDCTTAENGCIQMKHVCNNATCYTQSCDPNDFNQRCKPHPIDCRKKLVDDGVVSKIYDCQAVECVDGVGCKVSNNDTYCQERREICKYGVCDPSRSNRDDGCYYTEWPCKVGEFAKCDSVWCELDPATNQEKCDGENCEVTNCFPYDEKTGKHFERCPPNPDQPCGIHDCNESASSEEERCIYSPMPKNENMCLINTCDETTHEIVVSRLTGDNNPCKGNNTKCRTYACDPDGNDGKGACVESLVLPDFDTTSDPCVTYECNDALGWYAVPKCPQTKNCSIAKCSYDGTCYEEPVSCAEKVVIPNECMQAVCSEEKGCFRRQYAGAYFDICGNCIRSDPFVSSSKVPENVNCVSFSEVPMTKEGLAAAAVALIVLGVIVIGAALAVTGVMGTKALIDRARGAANQSVVSNPLFQDSETEMTNPAFIGDTV